ncbi:MAG: hypothetical protein WBB85_00710 [Albidovulum sp.]|uniref:hypothetical protein n=1 Tax=Albidovulum sp. TaxID=1872424 RepID=UPI003CBED1C6
MQTMTSKPEPKHNAPVPIPKAQLARIKMVADKRAARADGPSMNLKFADGVLNVTLTHADPDVALSLDKTSRERVKQASRDLLASIKVRLAELDRFWEKEQTKADVEVFILDEVFASLPSPPFTPDEKKALAASVYAHVWQQAVNGGFAQAA